MSQKFLCIHGHFYQPPRENPWLERIEIEDSARPFHDWNDRIAMECYGPNTASRIIVGNPVKIKEIINNYSKISFNYGPTLLAWMEKERPRIYAAILDADRQSRKARSGHGNALAQIYNHVIMPLTTRRDKITQIRWGISDFEFRFGRKPEGMWLAETAADLETLQLLAENGIRFTILAPHQAKRVRPLTGGEWRDVTGARIDPSKPYLARLPDNRSIALFFYDGPISRAIAFEGLLTNGSNYVNRLMGGFSDQRDWAQLVHVATDGESYGHHHAHGDMALAFTIDQIEKNKDVTLTNYGEFLERFPPVDEVEILENTSWSCSHGVERWRSNCGCNLGRGWSQDWRKPLRDALQWLEAELDTLFLREGTELFRDPWEARDRYIDVILDRGDEIKDEFLNGAAVKPLTPPQREKALTLLEMERHTLLMQTSCAWFFDEISGIETTQALKYASRAIQLASIFSPQPLEETFIQKLSLAPSNIKDIGDGGKVYERYVRPALIGLDRVVAHYAISSLFETLSPERTLFCYEIVSEDYQAEEFGGTRLAVGRVWIRSKITEENKTASFAALYVGGQDFHCAIRSFETPAAYKAMQADLFDQFARHTVTDLIRAVDRHFGNRYFSVQDLFLEARRRILGEVLRESIETLEGDYLVLYEKNQKLMSYLSEIQVPAPESFRVAASFVLQRHLREQIAKLDHADPDVNAMEQIQREARRWNVTLDVHAAAQSLRRKMEHELGSLAIDPIPEHFQRFEGLYKAAKALDTRMDLWGVQNQYFQLRKQILPEWRKQFAAGETEMEDCIKAFDRMGELLDFQIAGSLEAVAS